MPGNSRNSAQNAAKDPVAFEDALKRLESIVDSMEGGDLPLETLLGRFEEGIRLVKLCQRQLEQAELKIKQLEKNTAGDIVLKPVEEAENSGNR